MACPLLRKGGHYHGEYVGRAKRQEGEMSWGRTVSYAVRHLQWNGTIQAKYSFRGVDEEVPDVW